MKNEVVSPDERVLWEEGMFLGPQHFQAWERHLLRQVQARLAAVRPFGYGFTDLTINAAVLANGSFQLQRASGVFRDGTVFDAPAAAPLPPTIPFANAFPAHADALHVFLAIREARSGAILTDPEDPQGVGRYRKRVRQVIDELSGTAPRDVATAALDLRLLLDGESQDGYEVLPVARIVRDGQGYKLDALAKDVRKFHAAFVPPCLAIGASAVIVEHLDRITQDLVFRSTDLTRDRQQRQAGTIQLSASEAANFWLLHTINSYLPVLLHHFRMPVGHPEDLYRTMVALAGALSTYGTGRNVAEAPAYQHDDLGTTFGGLRQWIGDLGAVVIVDSSKRIALELIKDMHRGTVPAEIPDNAEFYLGVSAANSIDKVLALPAEAKIGTPERVDSCRKFQLSGVPITHVKVPPSDITITPGFQYFQVGRESKLWTEVRQAKTLVVFVPSEFKDVRLECLYVPRTSRPS